MLNSTYCRSWKYCVFMSNRHYLPFMIKIPDIVLRLSFDWLFSYRWLSSSSCPVRSVSISGELYAYRSYKSYFISRFLLARHKAALEVYNEAAKLSTKDWVWVMFIKLILTSLDDLLQGYTVFNDQCTELANMLHLHNISPLLLQSLMPYSSVRLAQFTQNYTLRCWRRGTPHSYNQ